MHEHTQIHTVQWSYCIFLYYSTAHEFVTVNWTPSSLSQGFCIQIILKMNNVTFDKSCKYCLFLSLCLSLSFSSSCSVFTVLFRQVYRPIYEAIFGLAVCLMTIQRCGSVYQQFLHIKGTVLKRLGGSLIFHVLIFHSTVSEYFARWWLPILA